MTDKITDKIIVETFTLTELLEKAMELGFHTIHIYGRQQYIEDALKAPGIEEDYSPDWLMVGDMIFKATDIMNSDIDIYFLDY